MGRGLLDATGDCRRTYRGRGMTAACRILPTYLPTVRLTLVIAPDNRY